MKPAALLGATALLLVGLASGHGRTKRPPVFLNHFFVVVDSATYKEIEQSAFMRREFAVTERRTTVRNDMSYTALYFYGLNTYFEFFDASAQGRFNGSGLALGPDRAGALQEIVKELAPEISAAPEPVTRQYEGQQVPWFYAAGPKDSSFDAGFTLWLMEYHPRFLSEWHPRRGGRNGGVSRKQVLQRYAAVLQDIPARPLFEDVIALTIAATGPERERLAGLCGRLGYSRRAVSGATVLKGPGVELRLVAGTGDARGIREITMRVRGAPEGQTEFRFGPNSVLRFHGNGLATWSLR